MASGTFWGEIGNSLGRIANDMNRYREKKQEEELRRKQMEIYERQLGMAEAREKREQAKYETEQQDIENSRLAREALPYVAASKRTNDPQPLVKWVNTSLPGVQVDYAPTQGAEGKYDFKINDNGKEMNFQGMSVGAAVEFLNDRVPITQAMSEYMQKKNIDREYQEGVIEKQGDETRKTQQQSIKAQTETADKDRRSREGIAAADRGVRVSEGEKDRDSAMDRLEMQIGGQASNTNANNAALMQRLEKTLASREEIADDSNETKRDIAEGKNETQMSIGGKGGKSRSGGKTDEYSDKDWEASLSDEAEKLSEIKQDEGSPASDKPQIDRSRYQSIMGIATAITGGTKKVKARQAAGLAKEVLDEVDKAYPVSDEEKKGIGKFADANMRRELDNKRAQKAMEYINKRRKQLGFED